MTVTLKATQRQDHKPSVTKQIRKDGQVPAVFYGNNHASTSIMVDRVELLKTVREEGRNAIISLDVENGKTVDVMLHDYQIDSIKDEYLHADFYVVNMQEEMDVEVPLRLEGEAPGSKEGGVLQQPVYELQVRAKPADIPEEITVDVSELAIGDSISLVDLPKADYYEFLDEDDTTLATVVPPTEEEPEEPVEGDESAEPELVNAKEDEEEK